MVRRAWMDRPHELVEFEASDLCVCGSLWEAEIHNVPDPVFACCVDPSIACCNKS